MVISKSVTVKANSKVIWYCGHMTRRLAKDSTVCLQPSCIVSQRADLATASGPSLHLIQGVIFPREAVLPSSAGLVPSPLHKWDLDLVLLGYPGSFHTTPPNPYPFPLPITSERVLFSLYLCFTGIQQKVCRSMREMVPT